MIDQVIKVVVVEVVVTDNCNKILFLIFFTKLKHLTNSMAPIRPQINSLKNDTPLCAPQTSSDTIFKNR